MVVISNPEKSCNKHTCQIKEMDHHQNDKKKWYYGKTSNSHCQNRYCMNRILKDLTFSDTCVTCHRYMTYVWKSAFRMKVHSLNMSIACSPACSKIQCVLAVSL